MSRFYEDAQEARLHAYVARELGKTPEELDGYPYELESGGLRWRVVWDDEVPPGVKTAESAGQQWSEIHPHYEPDGPEEA